MYTDLPEFTRCCFCAPLRIGLMAWGYIKLIISIMIWVAIVDTMMVMLSRRSGISVVFILTVLMQFMDQIFTVILLIAAHKKHEKLFKLYYIYTIVFLVLLCLYCGLHLILMTMSVFEYPHPYLFNFLILAFVTSIAVLMIQAYISLLVRSEMLKLRNRSNIQFNNHTTEEAKSNAFVGKEYE